MRRLPWTLVYLLLFVLFGACQSHQTTVVSDAEAVRIEGWDGVNNLFRSGRMYFAGQPDEASLVRLATEAGVRTVVNLRGPEEMSQVGFDEHAVADSLGLRYVNIPVSPDSFSAEDVERFAAVLEQTDEPVLLHCASSNRVGGMWAAYLAMHRNLTLDDAVELGESAGLRSPGMVDATRRVAGKQLQTETG